MKKYRTPKGYVAPLKTRAAILDFLRTAQDARRGYGLFCFNVKLYGLDLSFDHLLAIARENADYLQGASDRYIGECRALFESEYADDKGQRRLEEWAIEDARDSVTGDSTHRMLWDGENEIAEWGFAGRSGGWLVLTAFEGVSMVPDRRYCFDLFTRVEEMPFAQLRRLYRFIVQCQHDFRREAVRSEVEYKAAWAFFVNVCEDQVESDSDYAARLASQNAEAAERAHWEARDTVTIP